MFVCLGDLDQRPRFIVPTNIVAALARFPPEDVAACLADDLLQRRSAREVSGQELDVLACRRDRAIADGAPERAEWIWFTAPDHAWRSQAGTEGSLLYDRETGEQLAYVETAMS